MATAAFLLGVALPAAFILGTGINPIAREGLSGPVLSRSCDWDPPWAGGAVLQTDIGTTAIALVIECCIAKPHKRANTP